MESTRPSKRQKVTIACDACRSRKAKCDGVEPVCGPCRKRVSRNGATCTWSTASRLHTSNGHVRQLQGRIAQLEAGQQRNGVNSSETRVQEKSPPNVNGAQRQLSGPTLSPFQIRSNDSAQQLNSADAAQSSDSSPVYTVIGPTASEENSEGFYGSSSAGTFMQSVSLMVEQRLKGSTTSRAQFLSPPSDQHLSPPAKHSQNATLDPGEVSLPLRKTADELMQVYWEVLHPTFPILERSETGDLYERIWTGQNDVVSNSRSFLCLLNAIFSLSTQLNSQMKPQDRGRIATQFYDRARSLLDIFQKPSLHTVQALLLLSMYCQSSSNAHQCWMYMGLATRIAQSLGLHSPQTSERASDQRVKQTLRRVWHGCVLLDRIVASTSGRPCGIGARNSSAVPLPTSAHDPQNAVVIDYFSHATRLCCILDETIYSLCSPWVSQVQSLDELYDHYFGHNPNDPAKPSVFDVENKLRRWHENIPEFLKLDHLQPRHSHHGLRDDQSIQHRLAVILQQNYLQVRLLLLRPFLSAVITSEPSQMPTASSANTASLSWNISLQCAVACVRVAQDIVSLLQSQRAATIGEVGSTSAWWFNVLFIYASATVFLASLISPSIINEITEASIVASWDLALELLQEYTAFGAPITRLTTTLRVLFDTVPTQHSHRKRQRWQQERVQPPTSSSDTIIEVPGEGRTVRWRLSSPALGSAQQTEPNGLGTADVGNQLSFLPLPTGFLDTMDDPFDLAWLTDLPVDFSF